MDEPASMETELTSPAAARVEAPSALVGEREHAVSWRQPRVIVPYHSNRTHAPVSMPMTRRMPVPGAHLRPSIRDTSACVRLKTIMT